MHHSFSFRRDHFLRMKMKESFPFLLFQWELSKPFLLFDASFWMLKEWQSFSKNSKDQEGSSLDRLFFFLKNLVFNAKGISRKSKVNRSPSLTLTALIEKEGLVDLNALYWDGNTLHAVRDQCLSLQTLKSEWTL